MSNIRYSSFVFLVSALGAPAFAETSLADLQARLTDLEKKNIHLRMLLLEKDNAALEERISQSEKVAPVRKQALTPHTATVGRQAQQALMPISAVNHQSTSSPRIGEVQRGNDQSFRSPWSGFYAAVTVGAVKSHVGRDFDYDYSNAFYAPQAPTTGPTVSHELAGKTVSGRSFSRTEAFSGFHFGYNRQFNDNIVAGLEADISPMGAKKSSVLTASGSTQPYQWSCGVGCGSGTTTNSSILTGTAETSIGWVSTLRGRLGYATPSWLFFASAGVAFGSVTASTFQLLKSTTSSCYPPCNDWTNKYTNAGAMSSTLVGYSASVGSEFLVAENLLLRSEFLYYNLGSMKFPISVSYPGAFATMSVNISGAGVRSGLLYKF